MATADTPLLRIGVIGAGWFASRRHCPDVVAHVEAELTALCRRDEAELGKMAAAFGVEHTFADYRDLMVLTEEMFRFIGERVFGRLTFTCTLDVDGREKEETIDLSKPFQRYSFFQSLTELGGIPADVIHEYDKAVAYALEHKVPLEKRDSLGKVQGKLFDRFVEHKLIQPTYIIDYPLELSPLSKKKEDDPNLVERFELFIARKEIANAYTELNDPVDQKGRFEEQVAQKDAGDEEAHWMDLDFIRALEYGMPPTAGEGIGIDRLVMLFTDSPSIRDVILFPQLKKES